MRGRQIESSVRSGRLVAVPGSSALAMPTCMTRLAASMDGLYFGARSPAATAARLQQRRSKSIHPQLKSLNVLKGLARQDGKIQLVRRVKTYHSAEDGWIPCDLLQQHIFPQLSAFDILKCRFVCRQWSCLAKVYICDKMSLQGLEFNISGQTDMTKDVRLLASRAELCGNTGAKAWLQGQINWAASFCDPGSGAFLYAILKAVGFPPVGGTSTQKRFQDDRGTTHSILKAMDTREQLGGLLQPESVCISTSNDHQIVKVQVKFGYCEEC